MPLELERTFSGSDATNVSKGESVVPQFVSILKGKGLVEPSVGVGKNCISPNPPLPPSCYDEPPPPCVGGPPEPCYGGCYGGPPPCYMGR